MFTSFAEAGQEHIGRAVAMQRRMRTRRRAVLLLAMSTVLALCSELFVPNPRSMWAFPRSSDWWENVVLANFGQHDWMENFTMCRELISTFVINLGH